MNRTDIINFLIEKNGYKSYLEIGLDDPSQNFINIKCDNKESIDPYDSTNIQDIVHIDEGVLPPLVKECLTYRMTSDEAFYSMPEEKKYDIIFIDGLHTESQVGRDILNSMKHLSTRGVIVVHDCLPEYEEMGSDNRTNQIEWTGGVWKAMASLNKIGIPFQTITDDYGVGIIKYHQIPKWVKIPRYDKDFNYWYENRSWIMNEISAQNFFDNYEYYNFYFNGENHFFKKDLNDSDKHVVFACAKNEDDYIKEWVEHYLNYGFDKIFIADNNDDSTKIPMILEKWINEGKVQIFDCHGMKDFQIGIYDMFMREQNYQWCAYFDCDEFLELNSYSNIKDFLSTVKGTDCVLFHWMIFGSNGELEKREGTIQSRFPEPSLPLSYCIENMYVKPIIKKGANFTHFIDTHAPITNGYGKYFLDYDKVVDYASHVYYPLTYKNGYIKHYYTKSFEEWINNKTKRGWPDSLPSTLMGVEKYFLFDKNYEIPIEKIANGIFVDNNYFNNLAKNSEEILNAYKAISISTSTYNYYAMTLYVASLMKGSTDHVYIFKHNEIDNALFNIFAEYAIITGNHVACYSSDEEFGQILNKYICNNVYYSIDCL